MDAIVFDALIASTREDPKFDQIINECAWLKTKKISQFLRKFGLEKSDVSNIVWELRESSLDRQTVRLVCESDEATLIDCWLVIMAWGGQSLAASRGEAAFRCLPNYMKHLEALRGGNLSRLESYRLFALARNRGEIKGLDAPFFTKLIFFLNPNPSKGYIFDQWTAKSIMLLYPNLGISLSGGISPTSKLNSPEIYEEFCCRIEELAARLSHDLKFNVTPTVAEAIVFSYPSGSWRQYVNRKFEEDKAVT